MYLKQSIKAYVWLKSKVSVYLIWQFWALPIQQQIKTRCQKYAHMEIQ